MSIQVTGIQSDFDLYARKANLTYMQEKLIGKYRILDEIGRGGMGIVYRGEQVQLKYQVAVKTLPFEFAQDHEFLERIENEAQILAKLSHPNIVYIHDLEKQADAVYLIMEYVPGTTVADRIRNQGPYEIKEAARIIVRVASALEHAHKKGIIHRDIKPSNIMVREDNAVKVTDFGIAKSSEGTDITRVHAMPGTRDYMSPEQALSRRDIDGRSDLYSLGVVFYLMVTGKLPPYPLPDRLSFVPPRYEKIILKCLAEDRSQRYANAGDLIVALEDAEKRYAGRQKGAKPDRKAGRKSRMAIGAVSALLLVLFIWQFDLIANAIQNTFFGNGGGDTPENGANLKAVNSDQVLSTTDSDQSREAAPDTSQNSMLQASRQASVQPSVPVLRPAEARINEILSEIHNQPGTLAREDVRRIFALRTGIFGNSGNPPDLGSEADLIARIQLRMDQLGLVRAFDQEGCDLLIGLDVTDSGISLTIDSNVYGDDPVFADQQTHYFTDARQLLLSLEKTIKRYYCFNILRAIELSRPAVADDALAMRIEGGYNSTFPVGETIQICLDMNRAAHALLLSINSEGLIMLFPQTRLEFASLIAEKPFCLDPMAVSPPTGTELVVAIAMGDKAVLPLDSYLAEEDQAIIEPAHWLFDPVASDGAPDFCETLFFSLHNSAAGSFAVTSRFIKTSD